ncbi:MAG: metal ABC transporter permease [Bacteroidota bacterium]
MDLFFTDYTLRTVALGAGLLGLVSGALGTFAVLRQQSLLGDAISHAALPGIALAFLLTGAKTPLVLMLGAGLAGWLAALWIAGIARTTRVKYDSALGLMLAVFFGVGLMLLTYIQRRPDATQAGLDTFLFGQAAALIMRDVVTMSVLGGLALVGLLAFWKEAKLLAFDPEFGASLGLPMRRLDVLMTSLLVIAIVIGLQTVGVVLMSTMLIAPAAAARQWTDHLGRMTLLAGLFGVLAGVGGALISSSGARLPTGPVIVLCISGVVVVSLLLAPNRGLVWRRLRQWRNGRRLRLEAVLLDLYALAQQHEQPSHPHRSTVLDVMSPQTPPAGAQHNLRLLADLGLVQAVDDTRWALTPKGLARAQDLAHDQHRAS